MSKPFDFSWIEKNKKREEDIFNSALAIGKEPEPKPELKDEILNASMKSKPMKVGASDPGKQRDSFGFVGIKYEHPRILIVAAKRWLRKSYLTVEQKIGEIHHDFKYDHQVIEINNTGLHVWEVLKYVKRLPLTAVNTSKELNVDPTKPFDPFKFPSMDKNDMARWLYLQNEMGNLIFPKTLSAEMNELQTQIATIVEYKTEGSGSVSYRAEGTEHDDLYMALMLACWYVRENRMKPQSSEAPIGSGGRYYKEELEPRDRIIEEIKKRIGSAVPISNIDVDFSQ